jgi:hypothetical protein
MVRKDT